MAKVTQPKGKRNEDTPQQALDDLIRAIAAWCDETKTTPPHRVQAALQDLALLLDDAPVEPNRRAKSEGLSTDSKTSEDKKRGRHDERSLPSGYTYKSGFLRGPQLDLKPAEERTVHIARSLLVSLACEFDLGEQQLVAHIWEQVTAATPAASLQAKAAALETSYEAYFGEKFGKPPWASTLTTRLHTDAKHREQDRQRTHRGDEDPTVAWAKKRGPTSSVVAENLGGLFRAASGAEILAALPGPLPSELTAEVIEEMRDQVQLNSRGRSGKKTAKTVVEAFCSELERRGRK